MQLIVSPETTYSDFIMINSNPNVTIYVSLFLVRETLVIAATFLDHCDVFS